MALDRPPAHRGVVLVEPALLPALVPDRWGDAGTIGGVRLVRAGGQAAGTRPILLAPSSELAAAARALTTDGAVALIYVGTCASPTRALEPGDVLVVQAWRMPGGGEEPAHPAMAQKLWNRCERRGLRVQRGLVATGGAGAATGDLAEDGTCGSVLQACADGGVPAGALLVCANVEPRAGTEAPQAVLQTFDQVFGVLQEILGSVRSPAQVEPVESLKGA
jgi:hypothetical protein